MKDSATKSALDTAAFLEGLEEVARKTREEKAATRDTRVLKGRLEAALLLAAHALLGGEPLPKQPDLALEARFAVHHGGDTLEI